MTVEYHPAVQEDFNEALAYYDAVGGTALGDRFEQEFRACVLAIKTAPARFARHGHSRVFRRARFSHFPYLIVYRESASVIRIMILRHERRHPLHGMSRW